MNSSFREGGRFNRASDSETPHQPEAARHASAESAHQTTQAQRERLAEILDAYEKRVPIDNARAEVMAENHNHVLATRRGMNPSDKAADRAALEANLQQDRERSNHKATMGFLNEGRTAWNDGTVEHPRPATSPSRPNLVERQKGLMERRRKAIEDRWLADRSEALDDLQSINEKHLDHETYIQDLDTIDRKSKNYGLDVQGAEPGSVNLSERSKGFWSADDEKNAGYQSPSLAERDADHDASLLRGQARREQAARLRAERDAAAQARIDSFAGRQGALASASREASRTKYAEQDPIAKEAQRQELLNGLTDLERNFQDDGPDIEMDASGSYTQAELEALNHRDQEQPSSVIVDRAYLNEARERNTQRNEHARQGIEIPQAIRPETRLDALARQRGEYLALAAAREAEVASKIAELDMEGAAINKRHGVHPVEHALGKTSLFKNGWLAIKSIFHVFAGGGAKTTPLAELSQYEEKSRAIADISAEAMRLRQEAAGVDQEINVLTREAKPSVAEIQGRKRLSSWGRNRAPEHVGGGLRGGAPGLDMLPSDLFRSNADSDAISDAAVARAAKDYEQAGMSRAEALQYAREIQTDQREEEKTRRFAETSERMAREARLRAPDEALARDAQELAYAKAMSKGLLSRDDAWSVDPNMHPDTSSYEELNLTSAESNRLLRNGYADASEVDGLSSREIYRKKFRKNLENLMDPATRMASTNDGYGAPRRQTPSGTRVNLDPSAADQQWTREHIMNGRKIDTKQSKPADDASARKAA